MFPDLMGINRIRLEFKVILLLILAVVYIGINRIRLEFKEDVKALMRHVRKWY